MGRADKQKIDLSQEQDKASISIEFSLVGGGLVVTINHCICCCWLVGELVGCKVGCVVCLGLQAGAGD